MYNIPDKSLINSSLKRNTFRTQNIIRFPKVVATQYRMNYISLFLKVTLLPVYLH